MCNPNGRLSKTLSKAALLATGITQPELEAGKTPENYPLEQITMMHRKGREEGQFINFKVWLCDNDKNEIHLQSAYMTNTNPWSHKNLRKVFY